MIPTRAKFENPWPGVLLIKMEGKKFWRHKIKRTVKKLFDNYNGDLYNRLVWFSNGPNQTCSIVEWFIVFQAMA